MRTGARKSGETENEEDTSARADDVSSMARNMNTTKIGRCLIYQCDI